MVLPIEPEALEEYGWIVEVVNPDGEAGPVYRITDGKSSVLYLTAQDQEMLRWLTGVV
jgi:hypothetical protein